jgi:hypothetical protein
VEPEILKEFEENRFLPKDKLKVNNIYPNEYIILHEPNNPHRRQLGRFHAGKDGIVPLIKVREGIWGVHPKNVEQQFAMDALLNHEIQLVSLVGKAGTGKTLLAIAAGLETAISQQKYSRVLVSRPIIPMGRDLGFLPGDVNEKLGPWMQPIFDNIDYLFIFEDDFTFIDLKNISPFYFIDKALEEFIDNNIDWNILYINTTNYEFEYNQELYNLKLKYIKKLKKNTETKSLSISFSLFNFCLFVLAIRLLVLVCSFS